MQQLQITVRGRVQGVAFRWHARARARELGLVGSVRNRADGSVHLVAEGPRPALEALAAWALRGPERARVEAHELRWSEATGAYAEFDITG